MFLCTCIKVVVTTLPKFSRQISEKFLLDFRKWGKINKPSKKIICKIFVWTCTTNFWQACRNHACKSTKDLFRSKSENDSNGKISKRSIFPSFLSFKKLKKNFIWARRMRLWPPCPKNLVRIQKTVCSNSGNDE